MSDPQIIQDKLQSYYAGKFPDSVVSDFASFSTGWESDVYAFRLSYTEMEQVQNRSLVLRIYPGDDAIEKSLREYKGMHRLHAMGYPVPQVFLLEEARSPFDKPFIIMEKVEGDELWSILNDSSPKQQQQLLMLFSEKFVQLHQLDWRPFSDDPGHYESDDGFVIINDLLEEYRDFSEQFQLQGFISCLDWVDQRKLSIPCHQPVVVHMDFHAANVLLNEVNGISKLSIIDWTGIAVADYRLDLAWTLLLMGNYGNPEYRDVILREYARFAGKPIEHIELFDVLVCLRRLASMVVSLNSGAEAIGMRSDAIEAMKQQKEHFQAVYSQLQTITGLSVPEVETALESLST